MNKENYGQNGHDYTGSRVLNDYEVVAAKYNPSHYGLAEEDLDSITVHPTEAILNKRKPGNRDHALVALPLVRHWLFAPDNCKHRLRTFEVEVKNRGERFIQKITIGDRFAGPHEGYGVLKTKHQIAIFALQELWQRQGGRMIVWNGRKQGMVSASSWQLEESMSKGHGGNQKNLVRRVIQSLTSIPIHIENFIMPDGEAQTLDMTGLISGALFSSSRRRSNPDQLGFPWVEIALGNLITRAFEEDSFKPLNMQVMHSLQKDTSSLLYPKLDYLLSHNEGTELRLDNLVRYLGLSGEIERKRSRRRSLFNAAIEELQGQPLSKEGYSLNLRLVTTSDSEEDKLVAERKKTIKGLNKDQVRASGPKLEP